MAGDAKKFPRMPSKHWWALRDRFKQTAPTHVTPSYVATVLDMKENSARANIMPALRLVGLIDEDGKPTDRALKWRDDRSYGEVCDAIREEVYPKELLDAIPSPAAERVAAESWFARKTGHGTAAAQKMAQFYELVSEGDVTKAAEPAKATPAKAASTSKPKPQAPRKKATKQDDEPKKEPPSLPVGASGGPGLHIDLEVHISPDATPEQIDQIFASMAKHLYGRE